MSTAYLARWSARPPRSFAKSRVDTSALTAKTLLTYPVKDLAGDYVRPEGCDFSSHKLDPSCDLEHGRHPHVKGMPVCWARESLSKPGAPYAVEMVRLNFAADGKAADYHTVPVGTEYYDKSCPVSMQVFAMREDGSLPASSLEFKAVPGCYKSLGRSPLEPRNAYDFQRADVIRWTVCAQGVNPGALIVEKSLRGQVPPSLGKILSDRRVNVGGKWEPLHGAILKALLPYAEAANRTTVRVEKAMFDEDEDAMAGMDTDTGTDELTPAVEVETDAAVEDVTNEDMPASNGVTALYSHAQGLIDLCEQLDADLENTDSAELYKEGKKLCDMAKALAEKVKAAGDKHDSKLAALKGGAEEEAPEVETEEADEYEAEADMETDDDGVFKAVRGVYRKALVKRFRESDLKPAKAVEKAGELTHDEAAALLARIERATKKLITLS
jgi:hypothetical protein